MAIQIINDSQDFSSQSGHGPRSETKTVTLPTAVSQATAILTGFTVEFTPNDDHHFGQLDVQVQSGPPTGSSVPVTITYGLRDWSGDWDDRYDGTIFFAVVGE